MSAAAQVTDSTFSKKYLTVKFQYLVDFGLLVRSLPDGSLLSKKCSSMTEVKVVKLNTDENPNVASQHTVACSIPTLMIFRVGNG